MIREKLLERGCDLNLPGLYIDDKNNVAYFWLYNLTGEFVGYQRYNPNGRKKFTAKDYSNKLNQKYWTFLRPNLFQNRSKACLWGWQFYDHKSKIVFLVEGIFDAIKVLNAGYSNVFATLGNEPIHLKQQLILLRETHTVIVVADNDKASIKLKKYGTKSYTPKNHDDLGAMSQEEASFYLKNILSL